MAEFTKQRTVKPTPVLVMPRGHAAYRAIEIFVELGRKPAGCVVCDRPITPNASRVRVMCRFPSSWINDPTRSRDPDESMAEVTKQTYYVHPGCLTDRIRPEVLRFATDCYDCAALPPKDDSPLGYEEHPHRCFTVSKFAPGRLCEGCATKPRWRLCHACQVFFPQWMISRVAKREKPSTPFESDPFGTDVGTDVCVYCAQRYRLVTEEEAAQAASEFARLRDQILAEGVFGAGDD